MPLSDFLVSLPSDKDIRVMIGDRTLFTPQKKTVLTVLYSTLPKKKSSNLPLGHTKQGNSSVFTPGGRSMIAFHRLRCRPYAPATWWSLCSRSSRWSRQPNRFEIDFFGPPTSKARIFFNQTLTNLSVHTPHDKRHGRAG